MSNPQEEDDDVFAMAQPTSSTTTTIAAAAAAASVAGDNGNDSNTAATKTTTSYGGGTGTSGSGDTCADDLWKKMQQQQAESSNKQNVNDDDDAADVFSTARGGDNINTSSSNNDRSKHPLALKHTKDVFWRATADGGRTRIELFDADRRDPNVAADLANPAEANIGVFGARVVNEHSRPWFKLDLERRRVVTFICLEVLEAHFAATGRYGLPISVLLQRMEQRARDNDVWCPAPQRQQQSRECTYHPVSLGRSDAATYLESMLEKRLVVPTQTLSGHFLYTNKVLLDGEEAERINPADVLLAKMQNNHNNSAGEEEEEEVEEQLCWGFNVWLNNVSTPGLPWVCETIEPAQGPEVARARTQDFIRMRDRVRKHSAPLRIEPSEPVPLVEIFPTAAEKEEEEEDVNGDDEDAINGEKSIDEALLAVLQGELDADRIPVMHSGLLLTKLNEKIDNNNNNNNDKQQQKDDDDDDGSNTTTAATTTSLTLDDVKDAQQRLLNKKQVRLFTCPIFPRHPYLPLTGLTNSDPAQQSVSRFVEYCSTATAMCNDAPPVLFLRARMMLLDMRRILANFGDRVERDMVGSFHFLNYEKWHNVRSQGQSTELLRLIVNSKQVVEYPLDKGSCYILPDTTKPQIAGNGKTQWEMLESGELDKFETSTGGFRFGERVRDRFGKEPVYSEFKVDRIQNAVLEVFRKRGVAAQRYGLTVDVLFAAVQRESGMMWVDQLRWFERDIALIEKERGLLRRQGQTIFLANDKNNNNNNSTAAATSNASVGRRDRADHLPPPPTAAPPMMQPYYSSPLSQPPPLLVEYGRPVYRPPETMAHCLLFPPPMSPPSVGRYYR